MPQSLSFNQNGAVPATPKPGFANSFLASATPNAVNKPLPWSTLPKPTVSAYQPSTTGPKLASNPMGNPSQGIIGAINGATGLSKPATAPATYPGMLPTTPVKKITATDGTTTEFHAPAPTPVNSNSGDNVQNGIDLTKYTGLMSSSGLNSSGTPTNTPNSSVNSSSGITGNNGTNFQQNLGTTLNSGQQTQNEQQTQQGLINAGQQSPAQDAALSAVEYGLGVQNNNNFGQYADAGMAGTDPQAYVNEANAPDLAGRASATRGLANQYANLYGTQANAALNEANTIQGQGITAAQGAYTGAQNQAGRATGASESVQGATAPIANTAYGLNPGTGTYTGSGLSDGTSAADAVTNAGMLSGLQSGAAATAAAGGNIAAQNATTLGTATTAANAGSLETYTTQNTTIGNSIDKLDNISQGNNGSGGLIANMGTAGFNPLNTPVGNQTYANYYKNLNPAAQAGIQAGLGDIANNVSTVLSSVTGLTPTAVSNIVSSYDFQDLTPSQLNDFLLYVKGYASNAIAGNNSTIDRIKSGQSVSSSNTPLPAPSPNSVGSASLGTGASLAEGLVNKIISSAGDVAAGAVGGVLEGAF